MRVHDVPVPSSLRKNPYCALTVPMRNTAGCVCPLAAIPNPTPAAALTVATCVRVAPAPVNRYRLPPFAATHTSPACPKTVRGAPLPENVLADVNVAPPSVLT